MEVKSFRLAFPQLNYILCNPIPAGTSWRKYMVCGQINRKLHVMYAHLGKSL